MGKDALVVSSAEEESYKIRTRCKHRGEEDRKSSGEGDEEGEEE